MVCFPNAKINIGLNITSKRKDGFHNIETVFYPIPLSDVLEFVPSKNTETTINTTGIALNITGKENICYKAYQLLAKDYKLPSLDVHLHKIIPSGAGLGGGSADASFFLKELNDFYQFGLTNKKLEKLAAKLGSDCAFFIENKPVFAYGRGEKFQSIDLDLGKYYIYIVKPEVFVSTVDAYAGVAPEEPKTSLKDLIKKPLNYWKSSVFNDFELSIFKKYPLLSEIKEELYSQGAIYAAMSGSGSSIYGIFENEPKENDRFDNFFTWISKM
jgi:4-diphosphocytidyl-2-C-methyl-D-erythritol kinase